jgi:Kef-type K+ transport system membrane component KefB
MLLVLTAGAFLVPLVSERIGWFTAPCEMLYGILVVNLLPGADHPGVFITTLAQFGFLLLLFLAGLEIDFTLLERRGPLLLARSGLAALGLQAIAFLLGVLFRLPPIYILLLGALSISLLLVVLKQMNLAQTPFGQTLLVIGAIGEFFTILEVTGYDLVSRYGVGWPLALAILKLLALLLAGYVMLRWLNRAAGENPGPFRRLFALRDETELGVRAALAFMLAFAGIAVLLHVEQILATFIAGAVCSFAFRGQNTLTKKLTTMGQGFFVPIFFITVGMGLRFTDLLRGDAIKLVLGLLIAMLLVRLVALPLLALAGLSWRASLPAALLLGAPLTLMVAIAQVGINLGQLQASTHGAVLCVAILSAVLYPLFGRALLRREQEARATAPRRLRRYTLRLRAPALAHMRLRQALAYAPMPVPHAESDLAPPQG